MFSCGNYFYKKKVNTADGCMFLFQGLFSAISERVIIKRYIKVMTKTYKLLFHQKSQQKPYAGEDVAFCRKDFPVLKENDVIEIYNPEEEGSRLLLKVSKGSLRDEFSQKDAISIEQSIGNIFQLKSFTDVIVNKVDPRFVELDSLELTFKDQYLGRSEMWRLKNCLVSTCVYIQKKLEFCSSNIRCQICELWSGGNKVSSGLVTETTKIVFRSSTSMVYLFIQMSSEMWEFDIYGDLYFEKAVNGFLSELFAKWKKTGSNHEVTIVLFSRVYYSAVSIELFPEGMRECLQTDYKGQFYEDFYRVVIQNEKYEDWRNTLISLRHIFVDYHEYLINFHKRAHSNARIPRAVISSAAQGNFLEVLNMSLNVFEKHYIDRSFDRTGQLSVVITPGVGVFEVDRELTNVTMQRIIDNGVGSDLVCVGEQPLHAVPLLKFHNKATHQNNVDDYSMPHWINLSFYSTNKRVGYATYVPRIKLPTRTINYRDPSSNNSNWKLPTSFNIAAIRLGDEASWPNSVYDFDSYDENIFKPSSGHLSSKKRVKQVKRPTNLSESDFSKIFLRQNSEPEMHQSASSDFGGLHNLSSTSERSSIVLSSTQPSSAITIPSKTKLKQMENLYSSSFGALNIELKSRIANTTSKEKWFSDDLGAHRSTNILSPSNSSHGGSPKDKENTKSGEVRRPSRSLINPFDPSHAVIKLTSNRRRWTHIFPRGPTGTLIQQHHFPSGLARLEIVPEGDGEPTTGSPDANGKAHQNRNFPKEMTDRNLGARMLTRLWGATGEQEWTPALTTGVDWKSLTIPACLPLTTDYFPDERSLQIDYLVSDYSLLPDDVNADYSSQRAVYRRPLTTKEVFAELVSQRLAQGFQNVIRIKSEKSLSKSSLKTTLIRMNSSIEMEPFEVYFLSIGRIFHKISLKESTITVTRYRPRHPYPSIKIHYKYRFYAANNNNYEVSYADFSTEKLENYNWNYLDHYICTRGDRDFALTDNLKFWRFRMFILPINQAALKKILGDSSSSCNVYTPISTEEKRSLTQEFLKFIETCINRIRRPNNSVPKGARGTSGGSQSSTSSTGGFRERVNSNQLTERPRMKSGSGSKLTDKQRQESGSGRVSPFEQNIDLKNIMSSATSDPFIDLLNPLPPILRSEIPEAVPVVEVKLKSGAAYQDIIAAMRSQKTGFSFIKSPDLPPWTFVSFDAVTWLANHMEGIGTDLQAVEVFNAMLKERLILHASGDSTHKFVNGFYLYYIISDADGLTLESLHPHGDSVMFHNEWMEVEVPCQEELLEDSGIASPTDKIPCQNMDDAPYIYKDVYVDVDVSKKSDRQEWGHVRYQSVYKPDEAFEVTVQWIQATGAVITDLVQGWSRKAQQCNLQLVPIPTDPFALPYSNNSDPLRGPISVQINTQCLLDAFAHFNKGFSEDEWRKNMLFFQHSVALQFGFVRSPKHLPFQHSNQSPKQGCGELHYVHSSGNIFIIIQTRKPILQTEFLWSWNYMVSKRWRTSSTPALGDDSFMFKLLRDFKEFCTNKDNRLVTAWESLINQSF